MITESEPAVAAAVQTLAQVVAAYLDAYRGRDESRFQRIRTWVRLLGNQQFDAITPEDLDTAIAHLASEPSRAYGGRMSTEIRSFARRPGGAAASYMAPLHSKSPTPWAIASCASATLCSSEHGL